MKLNYVEINDLNTCFSLIPLKSGSVLEAAYNLIKLKPPLEAINAAKTTLIKKFTDGKESIDQNHPKWLEFLEEWSEVAKKLIEVPELSKIKKSDINLDEKCSQQQIAILIEKGLVE